MFSSHVPVTEHDFWDRKRELAKLVTSVERLQSGHPTWIALLGPRKIGKTSLLRELERQMGGTQVVFAVVDAFEIAPLSTAIFRSLALRVVDRALASELGVSLEGLVSSPDDLRRALQQSDRVAALPAGLRASVYGLADRAMDATFLRVCLDLPEQLARAWNLHVVLAIDEFQELSSLPGRKDENLMSLLRAVWQRHQRVGYVISGSERTMLLDLVTSRRSPFFGHFEVMDLGPFARPDAMAFLTAEHHRPRIPPTLAARVFEMLGGHPYYLQLFGQSLNDVSVKLDDDLLKEVLGELAFTSTGRLALHFSSEHQRLVGRSTALASVLDTLAAGPKRLSEIATAIKTSSAAAKTYIGRIGDTVTREGDRYHLADPVFARWLQWRGPGGAAVPMKVIGDEAEARVAEFLARMGFDLVYQSRASRGAFDLLAIRGGVQLGVQVKRTALPTSLPATAWKRMEAEGKRMGWRWVVAVVTTDERVLILDPARRRGGRLSEAAAIDNLLRWLDRAAGRPRRS
jgi:AAA+ ATPase superfamily predicted ATPase